MSDLLKGSKQARAALFCIKQIQSEDNTEDEQIAFAKLLPHSLLHAEQLPELRTAIHQTRHLTIYQRLPVDTRKAITDYLNYLPDGSPLIYPTSGSRTAAWYVPNVSSTRPRPSDTITKYSTQATSPSFLLHYGTIPKTTSEKKKVEGR